MRPFTIAEYHRLIEVGVLGEDDPIELLEGWIVFKMTRNPPHDVAVALASKLLVRLLPDGWHVRPQAAITTDDSEPEPDLAVVRGDERLYRTRHPGPTDILVVIEVSDTSLNRDRVEKARVYARAAVSTYWIVNLIDGHIEVYTDPSGPGATPSYRSRVNYTPGQSVPLEVGGQRFEVRVRDLLP
jgi:Uma2 family endonuclease